MTKTAEICLFNKKLNIVLPTFCFYFSEDKDNKARIGSSHPNPPGRFQDFNYHIKKGCRNIYIEELAELTRCDTYEKGKIFAEFLLAYILEKGLDLKDNSVQYGIWTNNGVRREHEDLIVFKDIDGKLEDITAGKYGYKTKIKLEGERFNLERLFRKYGGENVTLKQIDKSNPDLVDYLFNQEYEKLPGIIQEAKFILPPDILKKETMEDWLRECDIWPLSLDILLSLEPPIPYDPFSRMEISELVLKEVTIDSKKYWWSRSHFIVNEV
ncbi:MAG: hypothetical protein KKF74_04960 [Nanoarchaeota archaeon]|nr:hypothetical protein [Nanoarchaeota archaeon]